MKVNPLTRYRAAVIQLPVELVSLLSRAASEPLVDLVPRFGIFLALWLTAFLYLLLKIRRTKRS